MKLAFFQQEETERTELKLTPLFPLLPPVQLCFRFPPVLLLLFLAVFLFVPAAFAAKGGGGGKPRRTGAEIVS